jgi:hypothetical protein
MQQIPIYGLKINLTGDQTHDLPHSGLYFFTNAIYVS